MFEMITLRRVADDIETAPKQGLSVFHQQAQIPMLTRLPKELRSGTESKRSSSHNEDMPLSRRSYQALRTSLEYGRNELQDDPKREFKEFHDFHQYKPKQDAAQESKKSSMEQGDKSSESRARENIVIGEAVLMDQIEESNLNNFKVSTLLHGSQYGQKDFICKDTAKEFFKRETKRNDAKKIK